jgi:hypothetical protein
MAEKDRTIDIQRCLHGVNKVHRQRLGSVGPYVGMGLVLFFAIALLPLFIYMVFFNAFYFWIRRQKPVPLGDYVRFDRHRIPQLRWIDKLWCEYCEWANGSLQWMLAVVNEIERRYCPIQNQEHPHCEKAKAWRDAFLRYGCSAEEVDAYYRERYLAESRLDAEPPPR